MRSGEIGTETYFNPLSLCRERHWFALWSLCQRIFQSTLPLQGETQAVACRASGHRYFNPLSLCRERHPQTIFKRIPKCISIHSPSAVRDVSFVIFPIIGFLFQSTLPLQGETIPAVNWLVFALFQSTLPLQGETRRRDEI